MMNEEKYRFNHERKLAEYKLYDIVIGKNLICFSTGENQDFNQAKLKNVLEQVLNDHYMPENIINLYIEEIKHKYQ